MTALATEIPGYLTGTWTIDPSHSNVTFSIRHMMVSKVRGSFGEFSGSIVTADSLTDSSVSAEILMNSIDTNNEQRDGHLRSNDFFDIENHPTMTYSSTSIRQDGEDFVVDGELTLRGVTRQVPLTLAITGFGPDSYGGTRVGFEASAEIARQDFGVSWNAALETGGAVVSDKVTIELDIQAVLEVPQA